MDKSLAFDVDSTRITRQLSSVDYWRLRAVIGDVDRARAELERAQQKMQVAVNTQAPVIQQAAGEGVDIAFLTKIDWNDETLEIVLTRVLTPAK